MAAPAHPGSVRRAILALLLALPTVAGCLADAGPAHETVIEHVAPLPRGAPGVALAWGPLDDPLVLAPGACVNIPWRLQAHDLPRSATIALELAPTASVEGRLLGQLTPDAARLAGSDHANGTARLCAPHDAPATRGSVTLVASASNETVGVASVRVEVRQ